MNRSDVLRNFSLAPAVMSQTFVGTTTLFAISLACALVSESRTTAFVPSYLPCSRPSSFLAPQRPQRSLQTALLLPPTIEHSDLGHTQLMVEQIQSHDQDQLHSSATAARNGEVSDVKLLTSLLSTTVTTSSSAAGKFDAKSSEFNDLGLLGIMPEERAKLNLEMREQLSYFDIIKKTPIAVGVLALADFGFNTLFRNGLEEARRQERLDAEGDGAKTVEFFKGIAWRFVALVLVCLATVVVSKMTYHPPDDFFDYL